MESQDQNQQSAPGPGNGPASGVADPEITTSLPAPAPPSEEVQSHAEQQKPQDPEQQPQRNPLPTQPQRGGKARIGRGRGSSRAGRPSSSSGNHHAASADSFGTSSLTNASNDDDGSLQSVSIHARTPAHRGRGKNSSSLSHSRSRSQSHAQTHAQSYSYNISSSPPPADMPPSNRPDMDISSRSEKAPKQGLTQSFTFSTPQPAQRQPPGRRRARTLEFPTEPEPQIEDDAKVKGGHSLRKRARIDYAQMNEDPDDDRLPTKPSEEPQASAAPGTRSARKPKTPVVDSGSYDDSEEPPPQPQSTAAGAVAKKRAPRTEKQRTASPVPQRRPIAKRKSIVQGPLQSPPENPSPEQQPSDTELRDTIEVGAPLTMQLTSSSSNSQPSENGSNKPGQLATSPTVTRTNTRPAANARKALPSNEANAEASDSALSKIVVEAVVDAPEVGKEKASEKAGVTKSMSGSKPIKSTRAVDDLQNSPARNQEKLQVAPSPIHSNMDNMAESELRSPPRITVRAGNNKPVGDRGPRRDEPGSSHQATHEFNNNNNNANLHSSPQGQHSSSQSSTDSDATEIVPPSEFKKSMVSATEPPPKPVVTQPTKVTLKRTKQPISQPKQQEDNKMASEKDPQDPQADTQPQRARPLRRTRMTEQEAIHEDEEPLGGPEESPAIASSSKKGKGRAVEPIPPQASSPETPRKRGPGRPPKIRQSIEQQELPPAPKLRERRASRTTTRIEQPRPIRSHPPRDFSFLTPYIEDDKQFYPEAYAVSVAPTPLETPARQPSEGAEEQPEKAGGSLAPEEAQQPDSGEGPSNAPTPAAFDVATPAIESAASSRNASPEPVIESMRKQIATKSYGYPRIRSPSEFKPFLDDAKNLSDNDLYNICFTAYSTLNTWQEDWQKQKLICEDEDNAVRRRQYDIALEAREARDLSKTTGRASMAMKDFEIKGMRAEKPKQYNSKYPQANPELYQRMQDQIQAQAYGFEHDPRPSMIGRQNPEEQRNGLQNTRLRNRPKLSQRAAEAAGDEPAEVVTGRRTRRPRVASDESKEPSRAPTPAEAPVKRRRRRRNANGDLVDFSDTETPAHQSQGPQQEASPFPDQPIKKKRGPKPKAVKEAEERLAAEKALAEQIARESAAAATRNELPVQMDMDQHPESTSRKRRRGGAASGADIQPRDIPAASIEDTQPQGYVQVRGDGAGQQEEPAGKRRRVRALKAAPFAEESYAAATSMLTQGDTTAPAEPVRPSTSSSTSSMHTVESSYSFRNRKRKNYSDLADPVREVLDEPRPKRGRKSKNQQQEEPTSYPMNMAPMGYDGAHGYTQQLAHGYHSQQQQQPSVLALPNNNPFASVPAGGPGPLLAPSRLQQGHIAAPPSVGANPFSAPSNHHTVEPSPQSAQSPPRKRPVKIKLTNNRRNQSSTPQPSSSQQHPFAAAQASLQLPSDFHGQTGYEHLHQMYNGSMPPSMPGAGPGQAMFPVNATSSSLPPDRADSRAPGSGRVTPVPSSAASSTGAGQGGEDALSEKDYASMTKSEKMSASMKARWANGSMRQAVNKRKETLARKKQKQADDKTDTTPTPQPESTPMSAEPRELTTPVLPPPAGTTPVPGRAESVVAKRSMSPNIPQMQIPQLHQPQQFVHHGYDEQGGGMAMPSHPSLSGGPSMLVGLPAHARHPYHDLPDYRTLPPQHSAGHQIPPSAVAGPSTHNPFLDNGYVDTHPRLPFTASAVAEIERIAREREREHREGRGHGWGGLGP